MINLGVGGEFDHDAVMREHRSGLVAGRRTLRFAVALTTAAILGLAITGRPEAATGLAVVGVWIALVWLGVEGLYVWIARRTTPRASEPHP